MKKFCSGCQVEKDVIEFNYKNREKRTLQSQCKICTRKQVRKHYETSREYYLQKTRLRNNRIIQEVRIYIHKYLQDHPCVDCGEKDIVVLTFDHLENKKFTISEAVRWKYTLNTVIDEINKCQIRCANCHLRRTATQFGWTKALRL